MIKNYVRFLLTIGLALIIFFAGLIAGQQMGSAHAETTLLQSETGTLQVQRFERIWKLVHQEYFEQPLDDEVLIQGAIDGMLEMLGDKHTSYMPPQEFEMLNADFTGSYTGIGALVEAEGDQLLIVSPFDDSPAEAAGLKPGDEIVRVDNTYISEFDDPLTAITIVRGPQGSPVRLLIRRNEQEFEVTIIRDTIPLVSASGEMLEDGIAYVRVADFSQSTDEELQEALTDIMAHSPAGLILDLRGNPGGSLDTSIRVTSQFIGDGVVMIEEWGDGRKQDYMSRSGGLATDPNLPLIVLIDRGSASASEIVAGAIQDRGRGQLLGEITYGKGTVQNWHDLGVENGGVRITIARWLTPNGSWVHEKGITPNIVVVPTDADYEAGRDIQLESAVKLLLGQPIPKRSNLIENWNCCIRGL
jgi:carboxyl-terminal processing protease